MSAECRLCGEETSTVLQGYSGRLLRMTKQRSTKLLKRHVLRRPEFP